MATSPGAMNTMFIVANKFDQLEQQSNIIGGAPAQGVPQPAVSSPVLVAIPTVEPQAASPQAVVAQPLAVLPQDTLTLQAAGLPVDPNAAALQPAVAAQPPVDMAAVTAAIQPLIQLIALMNQPPPKPVRTVAQVVNQQQFGQVKPLEKSVIKQKSVDLSPMGGDYSDY